MCREGVRVADKRLPWETTEEEQKQKKKHWLLTTAAAKG